MVLAVRHVCMHCGYSKMCRTAGILPTLLSIALSVVPNSRADVLICNNDHFGTTEARVVIPSKARASFIQYVERGFRDRRFGLKYNGGTAYKRSITLELSDEISGNIIVVIESKAPGSGFVAWIQTCNTKSKRGDISNAA